jgi:glycosyltransferase involved in cell wall biosynthesis
MSLSIVVTTYNRASVLRGLLGHLANQTDPDFQVIVAIDGSTDDTEAVLASLSVPFELKWVNTHCKGYGLAVARNLGILAADRPAVAILDDDSYPVPGYVAAHKASVAAGVITGGPRMPADAGNTRMAWKMQELLKLPPSTPMTIPHLRQAWPNAYLIENNICMRREDFIAMGLFSERLKMYGYIGQEFFARAEYLGLRYQFNPDAAVMHHGEFAGDNGFSSARKQREIHISALLRPSLMRPRHYRAQVAWARAADSGSSARLPSFRMQAMLALPWRAFRLAAMGLKRRARPFLPRR